MSRYDKNNYCNDYWTWNINDKSEKVILKGFKLKTAWIRRIRYQVFTIGARGTRILNKGRYYWEILVDKQEYATDSTDSTAILGIGTKKAPLTDEVADKRVNFFKGENMADNSWLLFDSGSIWHDKICKQYMKPVEKLRFVVGILFDGSNLSFSIDGENMGVAFKDLHLVEEDLYPIIYASGYSMKMYLINTKREYLNLQDMCRTKILKYNLNFNHLNLPTLIKRYLNEDKKLYNEMVTNEDYETAALEEYDLELLEQARNEFMELFNIPEFQLFHQVNYHSLFNERYIS